MNRIILLDSIDLHKEQQTIRLKKIYNITLLTFFSHDIENIIHDYVHDMIEVNVKYDESVPHFYIENQYINCNLISFSFEYYVSENIFETLICSNNIAIINIHHRTYPYSALVNEYMERYYSQPNYFDNIKFYNTHYKNCTVDIQINDNTLSYYDDYNYAVLHIPVDQAMRQVANIQINNHKLFKNMIVIIKCIEKKLIS